jgi:hypothetical protein
MHDADAAGEVGESLLAAGSLIGGVAAGGARGTFGSISGVGLGRACGVGAGVGFFRVILAAVRGHGRGYAASRRNLEGTFVRVGKGQKQGMSE